MLDQNIGIIAVILKIVGGLFAFGAALFTFLALLQNDKNGKTKEWFKAGWLAISKSRWLKLPELAIGMLIRVKSKFIIILYSIEERRIRAIVSSYFLLIVTTIGFIIDSGWLAGSMMIVADIFFVNANIFQLNLGGIKEKDFGLFRIMKIVYDITPRWLFIFYLLMIYVAAPFLWIKIALNANLFFSFVGMLFTVPIYSYIVILPLAAFFRVSKLSISNTTVENSAIAGISVGFSFSITFFSFWIGKIVVEQSYVPQTFQMLVSNVVFDGMTILITLALLQWALKMKLFGIPIAIAADIIVAAILACASLYFGLFLTEHQLTVKQVLTVLIGMSPVKKSIELGPYFWAMHTAFIPTFVYLSFIFVAWLGKLILTPARWFFGKGQEHKNPLALTGALFALLATTFGLLGIFVDSLGKVL